MTINAKLIEMYSKRIVDVNVVKGWSKLQLQSPRACVLQLLDVSPGKVNLNQMADFYRDPLKT